MDQSVLILCEEKIRWNQNLKYSPRNMNRPISTSKADFASPPIRLLNAKNFGFYNGHVFILQIFKIFPLRISIKFVRFRYNDSVRVLSTYKYKYAFIHILFNLVKAFFMSSRYSSSK